MPEKPKAGPGWKRLMGAAAAVGMAMTSFTLRSTEQTAEATVVPGGDFNVIFEPPVCKTAQSQYEFSSSFYSISVTGLRPDNPGDNNLDMQYVTAKNINDDGLSWTPYGYADASGKATVSKSYLQMPDDRLLDVLVEVHDYPSGPTIAQKEVMHEFQCTGDTGPPPPPPPPPPVEMNFPTAASKLIPVTPFRASDTRTGVGAGGIIAPIMAGGTLEVDVAHQPNAPAGITAVVMNVTAIGKAPGFLTAYPSGTARPLASIINIQEAGDIVPNLITVPVGPNGRVSIFTQSGADMAVDFEGYYVAAPSGSSDGRFILINGSRDYDSRLSGGARPAGSILRLPVLGVGGIPASGVEAVMLNVTAVDAKKPGFLTVWPCDQAMPVASVANYDLKNNNTAPNRVISPVAPDGTVCIYTLNETDVVVDAIGAFTNNTAPVTVQGEFEAVKPGRDLDTRNNNVMPQPFTGVKLDTSLVGLDPARYEAVEGNFTVTDANSQTFGAAYTDVWENTSSVNTSGTRANGVLVPVPASVLVNRPAHMVVDLTGGYRN